MTVQTKPYKGYLGCVGVLVVVILLGTLVVRKIDEKNFSAFKFREVSYAIDQYAQDNNGKLPTLKSRMTMEKQMAGYGSESSLSHWHPILAEPYSKTPYVLNAPLSDMKMADLKGKEPVLIFYDPQPHLWKHYAAVYDGSGVYMRVVSRSELEKLKKRSGM